MQAQQAVVGTPSQRKGSTQKVRRASACVTPQNGARTPQTAGRRLSSVKRANEARHAMMKAASLRAKEVREQMAAAAAERVEERKRLEAEKAREVTERRLASAELRRSIEWERQRKAKIAAEDRAALLARYKESLETKRQQALAERQRRRESMALRTDASLRGREVAAATAEAVLATRQTDTLQRLQVDAEAAAALRAAERAKRRESIEFRAGSTARARELKAAAAERAAQRAAKALQLRKEAAAAAEAVSSEEKQRRRESVAWRGEEVARLRGVKEAWHMQTLSEVSEAVADKEEFAAAREEVAKDKENDSLLEIQWRKVELGKSRKAKSALLDQQLEDHAIAYRKRVEDAKAKEVIKAAAREKLVTGSGKLAMEEMDAEVAQESFRYFAAEASAKPAVC